jgi:hypothetical protein
MVEIEAGLEKVGLIDPVYSFESNVSFGYNIAAHEHLLFGRLAISRNESLLSINFQSIASRKVLSKGFYSSHSGSWPLQPSNWQL